MPQTLLYGLHDFVSEHDDEISFKANEPIVVIETDDKYMDGWWLGRNIQGQEGLFPKNYTSTTPSSNHQPSIISEVIETGALRNEQPELWTLQQVSEWLGSIGLESVAPMFVEQEITGDILFDLTMDSLKELGISAFGKRYKIMQAINGLRSNTNGIDVSNGESLRECQSSPYRSTLQSITSSISSSSTPTAPASPTEDSTMMYQFPRKAPLPPINCKYQHQQGTSTLSLLSPSSSVKHSLDFARPLSPPGTASTTTVSRSNTFSSQGTSIHTGGNKSPDPRHTTFSFRNSFHKKSHDINTINNDISTTTTIPHLTIMEEKSPRSSEDQLLSSSTLPPPTLVSPTQEGWLYKQSDKYKKWNKRWFVLKDHHLFYFGHPKDVRVRGVIHLRGYRIQSDPNIHSGKYCFKAQHDRERTFCFYTDTEGSMKLWLNALMKATITRDYQTPVMSSNPVATIPLALARQMRPRPPSTLMFQAQQLCISPTTTNDRYHSSSPLPSTMATPYPQRISASFSSPLSSLSSSSSSRPQDLFDVMSDDDEDLIDPDQSIFHMLPSVPPLPKLHTSLSSSTASINTTFGDSQKQMRKHRQPRGD